MLRRVVKRGAGIAAVLALLSAGGAYAAPGGAGTETFTEHLHEAELFSFATENPCTGAPGTLTAIAANAVFHITAKANGQFSVTGTAEGTATFTPEEPGGVSYSGHFASWFGEALNNKNELGHETGTFVLDGADGSRLVVHTSDHLSTNAHGEITVQFERLGAHCG
jgi:hypothetical protein